MIRLLLTSAALLSLTACAGQPPVILVCPSIPPTLLQTCSDPPYVPREGEELLDSWTEYVVCNREARVRMEAVKALADCRAEALKQQREPAARP